MADHVFVGDGLVEQMTRSPPEESMSCLYSFDCRPLADDLLMVPAQSQRLRAHLSPCWSGLNVGVALSSVRVERLWIKGKGMIAR